MTSKSLDSSLVNILEDRGLLDPKIYYRIVEMENGDFVLQQRIQSQHINCFAKWAEIDRGSLEAMQKRRLSLDNTYRPEYKTIKRIVEE